MHQLTYVIQNRWSFMETTHLISCCHLFPVLLLFAIQASLYINHIPENMNHIITRFNNGQGLVNRRTTNARRKYLVLNPSRLTGNYRLVRPAMQNPETILGQGFEGSSLFCGIVENMVIIYICYQTIIVPTWIHQKSQTPITFDILWDK